MREDRFDFDYQHSMPHQNCPFCGSKMDVAAGGGWKPKEGDITICMYCATPLVFRAGLLLTEMSEEEIEELTPESKAELEAIRNAIVELKQRKQKRI